MRWSIGSTWHRWHPHIHAPGTLKENQHGSHADAAVWERYFATIREAQPACSAIGISDYFVPRAYEGVCARRLAFNPKSIDLLGREPERASELDPS